MNEAGGGAKQEHIPAEVIDPKPPSRRLLLIIVAVGAFVLMCTGVGTLISLSISANNARHIDQRGLARDQERAAFEARLQDLQNQLAADQAQSKTAICTLIIASVTQNVQQGQPITQPVIDFTHSFGCVLPPALLQRPPHA